MARKPIEIPIASETRAFGQGIESGVIRPLEDAEDALKALAKVDAGEDIERDMKQAQDATERLRDETKKTARDIEDEFKRSYRKTADDADDATRKMKDGFDEAGNEAAQSAREGAASFTGEFDDVADYIQEVLANALSGFGPAGLVAGVAAAAGIGIAVAKVQELTEKVEEIQERANDVHLGALEEGIDVEGYVTGLDYVRSALERLNEEGQKRFRFFWEEDDTGLQEFISDLRRTGEEQASANDILSLGTRELKAYRDAVDDNTGALQREKNQLEEATARNLDMSDADRRRLETLRDMAGASDRVIERLDEEIEVRSEATERSDAWAESGAAAAQARADAEDEAAERVKGAIQSVTAEQLGAYDSMRDGAYQKATADNAAFNIDKWLSYVEEARGAADTYRANIQTMQLTPGEWENLLALPDDARTSIVNSYATSGEEGKARIRAALGDGGAGEAGAEAAVAFDSSFDPKAKVEAEVNTTKAEASVKELTKDRELKVKVKLDTSEYDNWDPARKTGRVAVTVDKAPWNDWRPAQKNGKVFWE